MTREANFYIKDDVLYVEEPMYGYKDTYQIRAIISKEAFTKRCEKWDAPCTICRFRYDNSGLCAKCPAMPVVKGGNNG